MYRRHGGPGVEAFRCAWGNDGYSFTLLLVEPREDSRFLADPVRPGRTGMLQYSAFLDGRVAAATVHPLARTERRRMFEEVNHAGEELIARLAARSHRRLPLPGLLDADRVGQVFGMFIKGSFFRLTCPDPFTRRTVSQCQDESPSAVIRVLWFATPKLEYLKNPRSDRMLTTDAAGASR